jgi:hypothetical protein
VWSRSLFVRRREMLSHRNHWSQYYWPLNRHFELDLNSYPAGTTCWAHLESLFGLFCLPLAHFSQPTPAPARGGGLMAQSDFALCTMQDLNSGPSSSDFATNVKEPPHNRMPVGWSLINTVYILYLTRHGCSKTSCISHHNVS